jgi:hypothetical protein
MFEMKLVRGEDIHKLDISKAGKIFVNASNTEYYNTHFHECFSFCRCYMYTKKVIRITDAGMKPAYV